MSTPTLYLKAFIEQVPTCRETTTLAAALEIWQKNQCERLVVISEKQTPLGLIYLHRLLPQLMTALSKACPSKSALPILQQPLSTISTTLEPLASLSANLSLEEFWPHLQAQQDILATRQEWALVDETGKFLGLLNQKRLLKFLALQTSPKITNSTDANETPENQILVDLKSEPALLKTFQPLFKILKQLPIPLVLQTNKGKILLRNQAWQQEFPQIQVAANTITEKITEEKNPPRLQHPAASSPNLCLIPNGRPKVWQFIKIPLGITLSKPAINKDKEHASSSSRKKQKSQEETETVWLVLAQDITEQHLVAQELAAKNADLIQLNRFKDEFLACISHELKTPLTAVLGLSTLLKEQTIGTLNERQARYVRLIHQSGRHLMTIVNDILDLTRIETGQMELILEPVNITTVCERAYKQALQNYCALEEEPLICEYDNNKTADSCISKVKFSLEIEPGLETIIADELRLRQMLINLLSNAIKFTAEGGKIGLKVSRWEGWIAFTVWDNGIGIPDDKQHLIFQKFQQLENPLTRQFEGAGLGLALTQRLSRMHGGDITFISKENQGSQFTLLLPPKPPQSDAIWEATNKQPQRIVLIVEAVSQFIETLSEQLIDLGYRVLIARTGTEALEKARRFKPQVIFINPVLPLLSGWDVLTLLKTDNTTSHIPVIVTATQADKELARLNRADGFLSLPVQPAALQAKLANLKEPPPVRAISPIVLRLNIGSVKQQENQKNDDINCAYATELSELMAQFDCLLHRHHYRVLEADDLEEAELLARVWQPHVILLNRVGRLKEDAVLFFKKFSLYSSLVSVPIVTLEEDIARAANQIRGLSVFYSFWKPGNNTTASSALLRALQVASGMNWKPSILVVDISALPDLSSEEAYTNLSVTRAKNEWLSALTQYIQSAGFKAILGRSWAEVWRLLQCQSVDLLLICWRNVTLNTTVEQALVCLQNLSFKPPIIVLVQQQNCWQPIAKSLENQDLQFYSTSDSHSNSPSIAANLDRERNKLYLGGFCFTKPNSKSEQILVAIATYILPCDLSKADLINKIRQALGNCPQPSG